MKIHFALLLLITVFISGCEEATPDTTPPVIILFGQKDDTAYLNSNYTDLKAEVLDEINGGLKCMQVEVTGKVNTSAPGVYYLDYDYTNPAGNKATTVTRTVHVVENNAAFLNGIYNVACSCTVIPSAIGGTSSNPTITTTNYTASVASSSLQNHFQINTLSIGSEYVMPFPAECLSNNSITVEFFHRNFEPGGSTSSGTFSATKDTFTIESMAYQYSPAIRFKCKNVYSKSKVEKIL